MKQITTLFITLLFTTVLTAQPIQFQKTYDKPGSDRAWAIAQTSDGGYILAGESNSFGAGSFDAVLTKTDAYGTVQWTRAYGGTGYDWANMVRETSDGGFIVIGGTESSGNGLGDIWIFKTNSSGIVSWQLTCGSVNGDNGNDIVQTSDGGYIATGFQNDDAGTGDNLCLLKLNSSGGTQWTHTYSVGANDETGYVVAQTSDGGYVVGGESDDNIVNFTATALVIKTDASGSVQWAKTYGGAPDHWINGFTILPSGDIVVAGASSQVSSINAWLAKLNPNGTPVWSKSYEGNNSDNAIWVTSTADGGFAVCGRTNSFSADYEAFLVKTDSGGSPAWSKRYGGPANDRANQVLQSSNGGYAIASNSLSFGVNECVYFIKTDSIGISGCNQNTVSFVVTSMTTPVSVVNVIDSTVTNSASSSILSTAQTLTEASLCFTVGESEVAAADVEDVISLYPNPATNQFTMYDVRSTIESIEVYSLLGEKVFSQQQTTNEKQQTVDISGWRNGIYFVRIKTEQGFSVKKFVKQ